MSRVVAPIISDFFKELHTNRGVKILCGQTVREIRGESDAVREVVLGDGSVIPADLVLVGVGILPNVELARGAGLAVANGICVNEFLQTDDANIYAVGDCVEFPCHFAAAKLRLESVQNAADQAQSVAMTIAGKRAPYRALPWFWTDQFDIKLQMAGISAGYDRIVTRGNPEAQKLSVFYFKGDRLIAIDSINRPVDHMIGRKLIAAGTALTAEQAGDESVDLKKFALAASA
jgi:3-phenylpropionate/trans-cinnamate dioxygenase ferredoxin reductase component